MAAVVSPKEICTIWWRFSEVEEQTSPSWLPRTDSTEGSFENSEEFIRVDGQVAVGEMLKNLDSNAVLYVQLFTGTCNSRTVKRFGPRELSQNVILYHEQCRSLDG